MRKDEQYSLAWPHVSLRRMRILLEETQERAKATVANRKREAENKLLAKRVEQSGQA